LREALAVQLPPPAIVAEAQSLWLDDDLLRIAARAGDEPRYVVIGLIAGKHWQAVVNCRGEAIRLISVLRSRARAVQAYEGE
jgi:hypothetical protein